MGKNKPLMGKEKFDQLKQQEELKKEYGITKQNVVVVEKKSKTVAVTKQFFKFIQWLFSLIFKVIVIIMVAIGLIALIFPEPRTGLISIWWQFVNEIKHFFNL